MSARKRLRRPTPHTPLRLLPRQGEPICFIEWLSQTLVRSLAWWPIYTAFIVTLILAIQVFHPFGLGK